MLSVNPCQSYVEYIPDWSWTLSSWLARILWYHRPILLTSKRMMGVWPTHLVIESQGWSVAKKKMLMVIVIVTRNMRLFADSFYEDTFHRSLCFCNHTACIGRSFLQCVLFMMRIEHEKTRWNIIWKMRLFADFWWRHLPPQTLPISQAFVATQGHRRKNQPWTMMLFMMMLIDADDNGGK